MLVKNLSELFSFLFVLYVVTPVPIVLEPLFFIVVYLSDIIAVVVTII